MHKSSDVTSNDNLFLLLLLLTFILIDEVVLPCSHLTILSRQEQTREMDLRLLATKLRTTGVVGKHQSHKLTELAMLWSAWFALTTFQDPRCT